MKRHLGGFLIVLLLAAELPGEDSKPEDIAGDWQPTSVAQDGQEMKAGLEKTHLRFSADELLITEGDNKRTCTYKLDPERKPPAIEIVPRDGPNKDKKVHGIYQLKGDMLMLCLTLQEGKPPPTDFTAAAESGRVLLKLQRMKK